MDNTNDKADSGNTGAEENPNNHCNPSNDNGGDVAGDRPQRTPFTELSQVDADLALARTLQEQVFLIFRCLQLLSISLKNWVTLSIFFLFFRFSPPCLFSFN